MLFAVASFDVIHLYFLEDGEEITVTVTPDFYTEMLHNFLGPKFG
jgi:hypothetical protein